MRWMKAIEAVAYEAGYWAGRAEVVVDRSDVRFQIHNVGAYFRAGQDVGSLTEQIKRGEKAGGYWGGPGHRAVTMATEGPACLCPDSGFDMPDDGSEMPPCPVHAA